MAKRDFPVATSFFISVFVDARITKLIIIFIPFITWIFGQIQTNIKLHELCRTCGDRYQRKKRKRKENLKV